jgi:hypothetical protein
MFKISQLIKFVSDLNPQNTPTRLCFYNFLRGYGAPDDDLTPEFIELFFAYCMDYPHWASNKNPLGHEVQFLLENFNSFYQQKFDLTKIRFPQFTQLVEIEHFSDLVEAISLHLKANTTETDKVRILSDQNKRAVAIVLRADKSIEVRTYDKKFTICDGRLQPLRSDLALFYTPDLELSPDHIQKIEVAPYITAQFSVKNGRVSGQLIRGYVFQKLVELKNEPLTEQTRILYPIKRLEQFFLDRRSDNFYQDLVSQLERTCSLIQQGDMEALKWGSLAITQAETALENVFLGDKLLTLLIKDLRHASQNHCPTSIPEAKEECLKIMPIIKYDLIN